MIKLLKRFLILYLISCVFCLENFLINNSDLSNLIIKKSYQTNLNEKAKMEEIDQLKLNSYNLKSNELFKIKNELTNFRFLETTNNLNILFLTDIHLDIYYDSNAEVENLMCKKAKGTIKYTYDSAKQDSNFEFDTNSINLKINDYGKFKCDTNKNLLKLILDKAQMVQDSSNPYDYIIILGDDISHNLNFDKKSLIKNYEMTFKYINEEIKNHFPTTTILFAIGNNDFAERYEFPDIEKYNSQLLVMEKYLTSNNKLESDSSSVLSLITKIKKDEKSSQDPNTSDYYDSWYSYPLNDKITAIFINSILINSKIDQTTYNSEKFNQLNSLINRQFDFLETELKKAVKENKQVTINYHIPINNFYAAFSKEEKLVNNIIEKHNIRFDSLMKNYRTNILCIFSGHLHYTSLSVRKSKLEDLNENSNNTQQIKSRSMKKRRLPKNYNELLNNYEPYIPSFSMPGITPVSGSNPGFSVVKFENSNIKSITLYNFNLNSKAIINKDMSDFNDRDNLLKNNFTEFKLKEEFKLIDFSAKEIYNYLFSLLDKKEYQENYIKYVTGFHDVDNKNYNQILTKLFDEKTFSDAMLREKFNELVCSSITTILQEKIECFEAISKFTTQ